MIKNLKEIKAINSSQSYQRKLTNRQKTQKMRSKIDKVTDDISQSTFMTLRKKNSY
jgi:hypothetical protein